MRAEGDVEYDADVTDDPQIILARATINMPGGVRAGHEYWVRPDSPYVAAALANAYFVRVEETTNDVGLPGGPDATAT